MNQERYLRQTALPGFGEEGQLRLTTTKVLIVGVGGLGAPIALYLTAAGIGEIGIIDDDVVSLSNLQRQVLYSEADLGKSKVACATQRLQALNSEVHIQPYAERLTTANAEALIRHYDIIVDGCDNFSTRYLLSDLCTKWHKPYVYGAIQGFEGQVAVFHPDHSQVTYRDLYPENEEIAPDTQQDTAEALRQRQAVVGTTPAVVGGVEANEVIKIITGCGEPLYGKLWTIQLLTMQSYVLQL